MSIISVAIDGPAGAGKSTIAKLVAKDKSLCYIDTGAMYRTIAYFAIENKIDYKNDAASLTSRLDEAKIDVKYIDGVQHMLLCGEDITSKIRTEAVSMGASGVAVIPEVRLKLVEQQREMAKTESVIMDGRDIGTYVLPNADVKIFLTASVDERAKRRYDEMLEKGQKVSLDDIKRDIIARDKNDMERETAPLKQADDAVLVDTTGLTIEQVVARIEEVINDRI